MRYKIAAMFCIPLCAYGMEPGTGVKQNSNIESSTIVIPAKIITFNYVDSSTIYTPLATKIHVNKMESSSIYKGVSKFTFYTSGFVLFCLGLYIGSSYP